MMSSSKFSMPYIRKHWGDWLLVLVLILGAVIILTPILWMLMTALKTPAEVMEYPPKFFPKKLMFSNFVEAFKRAPFGRYTLNTLFVAFFVVIGSVLVNSFVAYGFAKIQFKGKEFLFKILLATMMIPTFVMLVPTFVLFTKLGWVGTYLPLIVPAFTGNAFHIFMMRQFYQTIPNSLSEAAKVDGAGHFYIWSRLMTPLIKPLLATVALIAFKGTWNDFLGPLLYVKNESMYTIQIGLQVFRGSVLTSWNYLMAMSLFSMLPVVILFFCFQNYFIQGMNVTGANK